MKPRELSKEIPGKVVDIKRWHWVRTIMLDLQNMVLKFPWRKL